MLGMEAHNDNNPFTFTTLGAATLNVVRWLDPKEQRPDEREKTPDCEIERKREQERFIETRLREIDRFEARYRRGQNRSRR